MNPGGYGLSAASVLLLLALFLSSGQAGSLMPDGAQCTPGDPWSFQTEAPIEIPKEPGTTTEEEEEAEEEDPEC